MPGESTPLCCHCGLPCDPVLIADVIGGEKKSFCCHGCQGAYRIITGAGLGQFYQRRNWQEQGVPPAAFETGFQDEYLYQFTRHTAAGSEISLLIEGIRCATCVWLIEKILASQPGVVAARINFGNHRLHLVFDPEETTAGTVIAAISRIGYLARPFTREAAQRQAEDSQRSLLIRFGTAAFLSMQLMGYSFALYAGYFQGIDARTKNFIELLAALVTTPVVFYSGFPFLAGAWKSLRHRSPGMDLLVSLGVLVAYGYSLWAMTQGLEVYFDTAAMVVTLILLGRLLEGSARGMAGSGIDRLLRLTPEMAIRLNDNGEQEHLPSASLKTGDRILVPAGQRLPVDGIIDEGTSEFDEAVVTGESIPVRRGPGARIIAGALNLSGSVHATVTHPASDSFIARIARLVDEAQSRRAPIQSMADKVAVIFVPLVVSIAVMTSLYWLLIAQAPASAFLNGVAVLVVACPCALGLATPTAVLVATGAAAARGILFRGGDVLEATAKVRIAAFDKTGTLTRGLPAVQHIAPLVGTEVELLTLAASLEHSSTHPLAQGIMKAANQRGITAPPSPAQNIPGRGVTRLAGQSLLRAGTREFLAEHGVTVPLPAHELTEVHLAVDQQYQGAIYLDDAMRPEAPTVIAELKSLEIEPVMLTGDHDSAARRIALPLAIRVMSRLTPGEKADWVDECQTQGHPVLMVGDGINDAPALSAASVGCAMAGSSDIALDNADLAITRPDLNKVAEAVKIARRALAVIHQNLFWAFFYNILMLPLAASGHLTPIVAAGAMAASSVCVVGNSLRLKTGAGIRPDRAKIPIGHLQRNSLC